MTLAHRLRRMEGPVVVFFGAAVATLIGATAGFVEGTKVRECPAQLADGSRLRALDLKTNRCLYDVPRPRPFDWYSPTELRRIATARERLERVKEKTK